MLKRSSRFLAAGLRRTVDQCLRVKTQGFPALQGLIAPLPCSLHRHLGTSIFMKSKESAASVGSYTTKGIMRTTSLEGTSGVRFLLGISRRQYAAKLVVPVPSMGDSITEGSLNQWTKETGAHVAADEVVAIIDTDKVSVDIHAPVAGQIVEQHASPGETVFVGKPLFAMMPGSSGEASSPVKQPDPPQPTKVDPSPSTSATAPIDKPGKKPTPVEPPKEASTKPTSSPPPPSSPTPTSVPTPTSSPADHPMPENRTAQKTSLPPVDTKIGTGTRIVPMSRLRKRIAERLKLAQSTAASLTTFNECDMSSLMAMRSELNKDFASTHNLKFGIVSAFVVAAAQALGRMPEINGYISESGEDIVYPESVDISIAVATPTGLLVPVLRNCESKRLVDVERELNLLATKARERKISLEELTGGTFTISNGGLFGSLFGTPILNPPQSSILGLHTIKDRPVVKSGEIVIRPIMYLALTYDHRLIDGREAVTFLNIIKNSIEDPRRLLLDI